MLELREVTLKAPSHQVSGLDRVSLTLGAGEAAVIKVQEGKERTVLVDAAEGLIAPDSGSILFRGESWGDMSAHRQASQRGRVGRVFEHYGWITNLDVIENIALAECHHTRRPVEEICGEIERLARQFGIDAIPDSRPAHVHAMVLRKLEWVRAFLGSPDLILLERPLHGAPKADAPRLFEAVCAALRRGAAVLWTTEAERMWTCESLAAARYYQLQGEHLSAV